ncbi:MAG: RNA-binding protein [Candidatus Aminicenantes bacterium]|nr:RNA-binding protein [Candidatus Aminicenantes bacterium]
MPGRKIYIGNLYCLADKENLRKLFSEYGRIVSIDMIQGTGYGYVEMSNTAEAAAAIKGLDGQEFLERMIKVKYADHPVYMQ